MRGLLLLLLGAAPALVAASDPPVHWRQLHAGGGGQVQGLTCDPNLPGRMYECSDVEGAYRSDDWGRTWIPIGDELIHHMAFHVAVTPGDPDTIYCGTLYGIHRSRDAGRTWKVLLGGFSNASWAFDPHDPSGRTWIAGRSWYIKNSQISSQTANPSQSTTGAYFVVLSRDGGDTIETRAYREGSGPNQVYTVTWDPTRPGHVYLAGDAGLFRSRDGGDSFESLSLPAGASGTRGADLSPDGRWVFVAAVGGGVTGTLHSAPLDPDSLAPAWQNVSPESGLFAAAGGNYWRPLIDPRSGIPAAEGGLGEGVHRLLIGSFTSTGTSQVGLLEGRFRDAAGTLEVAGWRYAFRRAGTAVGWNYDFGWNLIEPQCRQYAWTPRSWDAVTPPDHVVPPTVPGDRARILLASQQSVYLGVSGDGPSWTLLSSEFVRSQASATGQARFYRTRGFSSTVNFCHDAWETYALQGMADNRLLESFDRGASWTQDTLPSGGRVGNGDAVHILRPRTPSERPVVLVGTAPGAGGGTDTAVGTLHRKVLTRLDAPVDAWTNLGSLPLDGLSAAPRIWLIESIPANNDHVFVGTQSGLYSMDGARDAAPVIRRIASVGSSFKQGRIHVDPRSTPLAVTLHVKHNGSARLQTLRGSRTSVGDPWTFVAETIPFSGTVRMADDFAYWRRSADGREFMAYSNLAEQVWVRERGDGETNWTPWFQVGSRTSILARKRLPWVEWRGRGIDPASQQVLPDLSSAPDPFTIAGLAGHEDSLVAAAWVEDGKHGYAMLRWDREGASSWRLHDWTGTPLAGSFDGHMGVARVWRAKVLETSPGVFEYLAASRGGGLWARRIGPPVAAALASWRRQFLGSADGGADAADDADPDRDGRTNFLEYALGTDPRAADAPALAPSLVGDRLTIRFPRPRPELVYEVRAGGAPSLGDVLARLPGATGAEAEVTDESGEGASTRFLGLRVHLP